MDEYIKIKKQYETVVIKKSSINAAKITQLSDGDEITIHAPFYIKINKKLCQNFEDVKNELDFLFI